MQIIWLILFYAYTVLGYEILTNIPNNNLLVLPIDGSIPLVPVFAVPYLFATFMFLATPLIVYFISGWEKTKPYLIVQTIATTISYAVYLIYPTSTVRPEVTGTDIFSQMVAFVYASDKPAGLFPSGHVFMSIIIAYFFWKYYPKTRTWVAIFLPLIVLSTVFMKQHHVLDIVGGIVVAASSIYLYVRFNQYKSKSKNA